MRWFLTKAESYVAKSSGEIPAARMKLVHDFFNESHNEVSDKTLLIWWMAKAN